MAVWTIVQHAVPPAATAAVVASLATNLGAFLQPLSGVYGTAV